MKIVAVTACAMGLMHTHMAAKGLKKVAESLGHTIKVETQGTSGIENELTIEEIAESDLIILASDTAIDKMERFDNRNVYKTGTSKIVRSAEKEILKAIKQFTIKESK